MSFASDTASIVLQVADIPTRIGAFGFCFGGSSVLELARSGVKLAGIVTFHGGLHTELPASPGAIKTPILVLNGAADQSQKAAIVPFEDEMDSAGADWQFVNFGGAVHCFALETANKPGCKYDPRAARRFGQGAPYRNPFPGSDCQPVPVLRGLADGRSRRHSEQDSPRRSG